MTNSPIHPAEWQYDRDLYNPSDFAGFVYCITHLPTGRRYIGKKFVQRVSKRRIVGESNWRRYWGSSKKLLNDIQTLGRDQFRREILMFCRTRAETNYFETEFQFKLEVLRAKLPDGSPAYYNESIMGRFFCTPAVPAPRKPTKLRLSYEANPRLCPQCSTPISYEKRKQATCSIACGKAAYKLHCETVAARPRA